LKSPTRNGGGKPRRAGEKKRKTRAQKSTIKKKPTPARESETPFCSPRRQAKESKSAGPTGGDQEKLGQ